MVGFEGTFSPAFLSWSAISFSAKPRSLRSWIICIMFFVSIFGPPSVHCKNSIRDSEMLLLVKDSPQGKKCLPPAEKSAYREEKKLLTAQRKKSLPCGEKTAYRVVVNLPYHPQGLDFTIFCFLLDLVLGDAQGKCHFQVQRGCNGTTASRLFHTLQYISGSKQICFGSVIRIELICLPLYRLSGLYRLMLSNCYHGPLSRSMSSQ